MGPSNLNPGGYVYYDKTSLFPWILLNKWYICWDQTPDYDGINGWTPMVFYGFGVAYPHTMKHT